VIAEQALRSRYLDLLAASLRNAHYRSGAPEPSAEDLSRAEASLARARAQIGPHLAGQPLADLLGAMDARQWYAAAKRNDPPALTMAGQDALDNVRFCVEAALAAGVPGDLLEAGVWRGGLTIFMRGILAAHGVEDRTVWVADSFAGLPQPDPARDPDDALAHELLACVGGLAVSADEVRGAFRDHDLLDDRVRFLEGWFSDTLPGPVEQLAVLRLDGDYYESTRDVLRALYPKLSPGGYVIVDDYGLPVGCRRAVDEYRAEQEIEEPILMVNERIACWRRDG
jgi:O-methyltransferase